MNNIKREDLSVSLMNKNTSSELGKYHMLLLKRISRGENCGGTIKTGPKGRW